MDNDPPEIASKEEVQEESKWNEIVEKYSDEDSNNLIWAFSVFEKGVRNVTTDFQNGHADINPNSLKGLWNIFLARRRQVVEAYELRDKDPLLFETSIKKVGMKHVDDLYAAMNSLGNEHTLSDRFSMHLVWAENALESEYKIETHKPKIGDKPDLNREHIISGSGDEISGVLQPAFIEKTSGNLIREATVETG